MNEVKKNDFFATLVKNQDLSVADLRDNNITPENSALLSKDAYKRMPQVQEAFKDDNGKFDEKKFNLMYDNAQILYSHYASDEFLGNVMENYTYSSDAWFAPADATFREDKPIILVNQRPVDFNQGISYITKTDPGISAQFSIREQAQQEKVVDYETGEELDFSPNDKAGLFSRYTLPNLVLAQWDEDGTHIEDGITVQHKAGDLKLNKNYKPYYETLGNREIYNKEVLRMSDVLTVDGSKWNKFDIFDSDDVKKSAGKIAASLVAKIAPMFLPYGIGEIYGYLGAADGIMRVMPVLGKAVNGALFGNDNELGQALTNWESRMARHDATSSDYAQEHLFSLEGIGNMISDVSKQLFQQRAVSTIPAIFAKIKGVKDYKSVAEVSRGLSLAYMAATSAQETYGQFKKAGATDRVAGIGMLASTFALYKLMNIDYFRDNLFKNTFMDESEVRATLKGAVNETRQQLGTAIAAETAASTKKAASFFTKIANFYENNLVAGLQKSGFSGFMNRGFSEGAEEVMEEVTTDLIKGVTEGLNALGVPVTDTELDFGWSGRDFAQRYAVSAVGGFLGGLVFAGQNKYQKWLDSKLFNIPNVPMTDMQKLTYMLATGQRKEIDSYLDEWHRKGLLGSRDLSIDGQTKYTTDGAYEFIPNTEGISQNDAIYNIIKNSLDNWQNAIEAEIPDPTVMITEKGWEQLQTLGYDNPATINNPRLLTASAIAALGDYNSFRGDLIKTLTEIGKKKNEIEAMVRSLTSTDAKTEEERKIQADNIKNNAAVQKLQEELKALREKKDKMFSGSLNKYYSGQAYFAANQVLQRPFINLDKANWVKLNYGRNYDSLNESQKLEVDQEYNNYAQTEGRQGVYNAFDLYLSLSQKYAPIVEQHGKNLDKLYQEDAKPETILGITDFIQAKEKWDALQAEKLNLEALATPTAESTQRLAEIENEMTTLSRDFSIMLRNPELVSIVASSSTVDIFKDSANDETRKIQIFDDFSAGLYSAATNTTVDRDVAAAIIQHLRSDYQARIRDQRYRFDDNELVALFRGIATSYQQTGGARRRLEHYYSTIPYDEDGVDPNFVAAVDIDPDPTKASWSDNLHTYAYKESIINAADNFIKNIGFNNKAARANFDEIIRTLKENTRLLEPDNQEELNKVLSYLIPSINGEALMAWDGIDVTGIIPEFDEYRAQSKYSPFLDVLANLGTEVNDLNLLQILQQETLNLSTSKTLDDYLIENDNIRNSLSVENLKKTLGVAMSIIRGASDGTNDIINNFKTKADDTSITQLATMSDNAFKEFYNHYNSTIERLDFLSRLAETNKNRSLRIHKETALNMRPKFIKAIIDADESFKTLWNDITDNASLEVNEDSYIEWEKKVIAFEDALHEKLAFDNNNPEEVKQAAENLLKLVNIPTLYNAEITNLNANKEQIIGAPDFVYYLATLTSYKASDFYQAYKGSLNEYNKDNPRNPIIPVYGQEFATRQIIAQCINPNLFNAILDQIHDSADLSKYSRDFQQYFASKSRLHNLSVVLGSAGVGKTIGVLKNTLNILLNSTDIDVAFIAREENQAKKAANSAGFSSNYWTIDTYCEKTFGSKVENYVFNEGSNVKEQNNRHWTAESSYEYTGNKEIFTDNGLKILVIDEIQTLSEPELQRICDDAESRGIFVIGLGDLKQPGIDRTGVDLNNKPFVASSGLEDCVFIKTPTLTTSLRSQTIAKFENTNLLGNALDEVIAAAQIKPDMTVEDRATLIIKNFKKPELYYWEDKTTGEVFGDMGVGSQSAFAAKVDQLTKLDGEIAIICSNDDLGKYARYKSDKISVIPYEQMAGGEWDYVLVDVDFNKHYKRHINAYQLTQDIYTLTQRSRKGTVIKTSDATKMFTFVPNETKKQSIRINENQFIEFNKWRMDSLSELEDNEEALADYFASSPLLDPAATAVTPPAPAPAAPTSPTPASPTATPTTPPTTPPTSPPPTTPTPPPSTPSTPPPSAVPPTTPSGVQQSPVVPPTTPPATNKGGETEPTIPEKQEEKTPNVEEKPKKKKAAKKSAKAKKPNENIEHLFLSKPGMITSGEEVLLAIADVFTNVTSDIRRIITANKKSIGEPTSFKHENPPYIRKISDIIKAKYGQEGVDLFNDILANATGYDSEQGQQILQNIQNLKVNSPKLSDHGRIRGKRPLKSFDKKTKETKIDWVPNIMTGDKLCTLDNVYALFEDADFYSWTDTQKDEVDFYRSPMKAGITFNRNPQNDELKRTLYTIGSYVRTGNFNPKKIQEILRGLAPKTLTDLSKFSADTKLWIVPYKKNESGNQLGLVVSRHYDASGNYFDIPVMVITSPPMYGQYLGTIEVVNPLQLKKTPDTYLTVEGLGVKYPQLKINKQFGVVKATKTDAKNAYADLNEGSRDFVKDNLGKVFTTVTDEIATHDKLFANRDGYGVYKTSDSEDAMIDFYKYERTGIQCRVTVPELLNTLKEYRLMTGLAKEFDWNDFKKYHFIKSKAKPNGELSETTSSGVISNIQLLKTDKGKIRQLLPWKRSGQLLSIAALNLDSVAFALNGFMHAKTSATAKETHIMTLSYKDTFINVAIKDGMYIVGNFNGQNEFVRSEDSHLKTVNVAANRGANGQAGYINLAAIFDAIYGDSWKSDPPVMHLGNYYVPKSGKPWTQAFAYNWELATMLAQVTDEEVDKLHTALEANGKIHGIFLDDHAMFDTSAPDTYWGILGAEGRVYETNHTQVENFTQYAININSQNIIPGRVRPAASQPTKSAEPTKKTEQQTNTPTETAPSKVDDNPFKEDLPGFTPPVETPTKPTLKQFIKENHLGVRGVETVQEANAALENKAHDWRSQYIVETDNGFEIQTHGIENFDNWFNNYFGMKYDSLIGNAAEIAQRIDDLPNHKLLNINLENTTDQLVLFKARGRIYYKVFSEEIGEMFYDLQEANVPVYYLENKITGYKFKQELVFDFIQSNLEMAEKIAIFEDQFEC